MKSRNRKIAKVTGEVNSSLARIKNSASAGALHDAQQSLQGLLTLLRDLTEFQKTVSSTSPEPDAFISRKNALEEQRFAFSPSYDEFELVLRGRQAMMRGDTAGLCGCCLHTGQVLKRFVEAKVPLERLRELGGGILVDATLEPACKLNLGDVPKPATQCPNKAIIIELNAEVAKFVSNPDFMVENKHVSELGTMAAVLQPNSVAVAMLSESIEACELASSTAAADIGPIMRFLCESTVGLKIVAFAQSAMQDRANESEAESKVAKVKEAKELLHATGMFCLDVSEDQLQLTGNALNLKEYKHFVEVRDDAYACLKKAKDACDKKKIKELTRLVSDHEEDVRRLTLTSFQEMCNYNLGDFMDASLSAIAKDGMVDAPGASLSATTKVIDLKWHEDILSCKDLVTSDAFVKLKEADHKTVADMEEHIEHMMNVLALSKIVLNHTSPRVAALYEFSVDAEGLQKYEDFLRDHFSDAVVGSVHHRFHDVVKPLLAQVSERKANVIFEQALALVDSVVSGGAAILPQQASDVNSKMTPSSPYTSFISTLLSACCSAESDKEAVNVYNKCKESLAALEEMMVDDPHEVLKLLGRERVAATTPFLTHRKLMVENRFTEKKLALSGDLTAMMNSLQKQLTAIPQKDEKSFMTKMKNQAAPLAKAQTKIDKAVKDADEFFKLCGSDLEEALPTEFWNAKMASATALFFVSTFTGTTLLRSPFCGQAGAEGEKTKRSLASVVDAVNSNAYALLVEESCNLMILSEMRKVLGVEKPKCTLSLPKAEGLPDSDHVDAEAEVSATADHDDLSQELDEIMTADGVTGEMPALQDGAAAAVTGEMPCSAAVQVKVENAKPVPASGSVVKGGVQTGIFGAMVVHDAPPQKNKRQKTGK